ncbi:isochorismatase family protein [archaeon]|jgi:nicotinamidase-related amidase|nr:isochorismatase family protein [archaeon]
MKNLDSFGVVVVDMQAGFERGMDNKEELINSHKGTLKFAMDNDLPIFFLEYIEEGKTLNQVKNATAGYHNKTIFTKYCTGAFRVKKNYFGDFVDYLRKDEGIRGESCLDLDLQEKGVKNIIISGVNKHACVQATTEQAVERGYKVYSAEDLMNQRVIGAPIYGKITTHFETHTELIDHLKDGEKAK